MKQGNVAAPSRIVEDAAVREHFEHEGQRTVISQRALQQHTDPLLGHTLIDGVGFVVADLSPYEADLDWGEITEPEEIGPVVEDLGRATAKIHCISDSDSDAGLVEFSTEEAIAAVLDGEEDAFVDDITGLRRSSTRSARGPTTRCSSTRSAAGGSTSCRRPEPHSARRFNRARGGRARAPGARPAR